MAKYASEPEELKNLIITQVKQIGPDNLRYALQSPESDNSYHLIVRMEPSTSRSLPTKTIASPGAFKLLWNQHLKNRVTDTEYYYDIFQQGGSVTASAAGWIFEFRMHQLLTQGYHINLFPLRNPNNGTKNYIYSDYGDSHAKRNEMKLRLPASSEFPLAKGIELQVGCYYRLEAKKFPTIDALLLIRLDRPFKNPLPILLMFQITRNRSGHDVTAAGLDMIDTLTLPPNTRRYYVAVTPFNIEPPIQVPKGRFKGVYAFHHPVPQSTLFPRSTN